VPEICILFGSHAATFVRFAVNALPALLDFFTIKKLPPDFTQFGAVPSFLHRHVGQVAYGTLKRTARGK
jgi:hypothetical protein